MPEDAAYGPSLKGRATGALLVLAGVVCLVAGGWLVAVSTGLAGTPGTLTVSECHVERHSSHAPRKRSRDPYEITVCTGTYLSKDGAVRDASAEISGESYGAGTEVAVQKDGSTYATVGWEHAWGWLALAFFGLLSAGAGVPMLVSGIHVRRAPSLRACWQAVRGTAAGHTAVGLTAVGGGGAAVCGLLAWLAA